MNLGRCFGVIALCCGLTGGSIAGADESNAPAGNGVSTTKDCGAHCVEFLARRYGGDASVSSDIRRELSPEGTGYCSMLDLRRALERRGFTCNGIAVDSRLPRAPEITVLRRRGTTTETKHFVVVIPLDDLRVTLYSPPNSVNVVAWTLLRPELGDIALECERSGPSTRALIIAAVGLGALSIVAFVLGLMARRGRRKTAVGLAMGLIAIATSACTDRSPSARIEPDRFVNLGTLEAGQRPYALHLRNTGGAPLKVTKLTTSCACTAAELDGDKIVQPGDVRTINLALRVSPLKTEAVLVTLECDGLPAMNCMLTYRGGPDSRVWSNSPIALGSVRPGETRIGRASFTIREGLLGAASSGALQVEWRFTEGCPSRIVRWDCVTSTDGTVSGWGDIECTGTVEGDNATMVTAAIGAIVIPFKIRWHCEHSISVMPKTLVLRASEGKWADIEIAGAESANLLLECTDGLSHKEISCDGEKRRIRVEASDSFLAQGRCGEIRFVGRDGATEFRVPVVTALQ